jgi:hypothetical protein
MTEVLTSFCAWLYGRRSAKNRAAKAMRAAAEHHEDGAIDDGDNVVVGGK